MPAALFFIKSILLCIPFLIIHKSLLVLLMARWDTGQVDRKPWEGQREEPLLYLLGDDTERAISSQLMLTEPFRTVLKNQHIISVLYFCCSCKPGFFLDSLKCNLKDICFVLFCFCFPLPLSKGGEALGEME